MEEWKKIQKKYRKREFVCILIMIVLFIVGIICDWNVRSKENIIIPIDNIDSFSLAILQIQATVGTLIFTIIALIAGNASESYMGVSVSDFYLNIKPWKLTQKVLIILVLGLNLTSIILHSLSCYNSVFFLFISTLIAILISIMEIYSALIGRNRQNQEIEYYINYILSSHISYENKLNIFKDFVSDWKKIIDIQDKQSYEDFMKIFKKYVYSLLEYNNEDSFSYIEQQCYCMLNCLLGSERKKSKENGLEFVQEIYYIVWNFIHTHIIDNNLFLKPQKIKFPLFSDICDELAESIMELNAEDVERKLRFNYLVDSILKVNIWLEHYNKKDSIIDENTTEYKFNYQDEIKALNSFARFLGDYLGIMNNKNNIIDQNFWASILSRGYVFSIYNFPDEQTDEFLETKIYTYFCYFYGIIMNGQENIVKKGLYLNGMNFIVGTNKKYQPLFYLTIHCYIYYLAIRESNDCVTNDIKQSALNLLKDKDIQNFFMELLNEISETPECLNTGIREQIYKILNRFELFPQNMNAKRMIMEDVVSDFYLFLILFMSYMFILPDLLEKNIDDIWAFNYILKRNECNTKELLKNLYSMMIINSKSKEQISNEVDSMYSELENVVKKKQKQRYFLLAKEAQKNYETNIIVEEICTKIKNDITTLINKKFNSILVKYDENNTMIDIPLLTINDLTSSLNMKNRINDYYPYIDGNFLSQIIKYLLDKKVLDSKNRFNDFIDDKDFMKYLSENDLHLLLGSKYILKNRNYKIKDEYLKFLEDFDVIYTSVLHDGIALKKNSIKICLHDINISIHSPTIKELNIELDKITGKYKYSILDDVPIDFDEEELNEFLHDYRKIIKITAKISIQINEVLCGTIITGRNRKNQ